jgi:hypothetical protein
MVEVNLEMLGKKTSFGQSPEFLSGHEIVLAAVSLTPTSRASRV